MSVLLHYIHYFVFCLFRKAWAEEEAKVQRSMVSYVLLRTRKSEKTRLADRMFAKMSSFS